MRLRSALPLVRHIPFAAAAFAVIFAAGACAEQAEGERCDVKAASSGDSDCQNGLVCTSVPLNGSAVYVCCPGDRSLSTTSACSGNSADLGGDAGHGAPDATSETGDDGGEAGVGDDGGEAGAGDDGGEAGAGDGGPTE